MIRKTWDWIMEHKLEITMCGAALGGAVLLLAGVRKSLFPVVITSQGGVSQTIPGNAHNPVITPSEVQLIENSKRVINDGKEFPVDDHLRKLPEGWRASQRCIDLAENAGFDLPENYTFIPGYMKNVGNGAR